MNLTYYKIYKITISVITYIKNNNNQLLIINIQHTIPNI